MRARADERVARHGVAVFEASGGAEGIRAVHAARLRLLDEADSQLVGQPCGGKPSQVEDVEDGRWRR
jgi:hypothetical protein